MNVLIVTDVTQNWQTFATWWSVWKLDPTLNTTLAIVWGEETPFQLFQWAKRLKLPHFFSKTVFEDHFANKMGLALKAKNKRHFHGDGLLILTPQTMLLKSLPTIENLQADEHSAFVKHLDDFEPLINDRMLNNFQLENPLCVEAKETDRLSPVVSYKKGCGRWVNTLRGCPFSNAAGLALVDMTANEYHIFDMWKQMVSLYEATA